MDTRTCQTCQKTFPLTSEFFHTTRRSANGKTYLRNKCRWCRTAEIKRHQEAKAADAGRTIHRRPGPTIPAFTTKTAWHDPLTDVVVLVIPRAYFGATDALELLRQRGYEII